MHTVAVTSYKIIIKNSARNFKLTTFSNACRIRTVFDLPPPPYGVPGLQPLLLVSEATRQNTRATK